LHKPKLSPCPLLKC